MNHFRLHELELHHVYIHTISAEGKGNYYRFQKNILLHEDAVYLQFKENWVPKWKGILFLI